MPSFAEGFTDALSRPAHKSALAAKRMLLDVTAAGSRLVAVGQRGHVLWSDDQGASWTQADVPVSVDLTAVSFATATTGWAVGHDGVVLRTTDAAKTWTKQLDGIAAETIQRKFYEALSARDPQAAKQGLADVTMNYRDGPSLPWLSVAFESEQRGFVVGAFGLIMRSDSGGAQWEPWQHRIDNPEGLHLNAVRVINGRTWIASERGTLFLLDAHQQRFSAIKTGYEGTFLGLIGRGDLLLAFGLGGTAFRSTDAGRTWAAVKTGVASTFNGGAVLADGGLALVSQGGQIVVSHDDATSFTPLRGAVPTLFAAAAAVPPGNKLAVAGLSGVQVIATS